MSFTTTETVTGQHGQRDDSLGLDNAESEQHFGAQVIHSSEPTISPSRQMSVESFDLSAPATGAQTPDPLFRRYHQQQAEEDPNHGELAIELERIATHKSTPHMGDAMESLARSMSNRSFESHDLHRTISRRPRPSGLDRRPSHSQLPAVNKLANEAVPAAKLDSQGVPQELGNFASEVIFVLVCSAGQLLFAWFLGDINVIQVQLKEVLGIENTQLPWLMGAFSIANGLSVMLAGSITDLVPPKFLIVGAFTFLSVWNIIGAFSLTPARSILFFVVRAMQGLAIGILVSGSMSILGRVYNPGLRKTRVFSCMAAMAPFGFWIGALQGGALSAHIPWIFGTNAMLCALCAIAAFFTIPSLKPAADTPGIDAPSLRHFDYVGALLAVFGSICLLFGLTQGGVSHWAPYTYALVIAGVLFLAGFCYAESRVRRPLIPNRLWKTKGFTPLMAAYFLGFGAYISWQFYAIQFFLRIQHAQPITVALYLLPNALVGVLATYIVSRLMHIVPGHWIYVFSMISFALGPVFFLPQSPATPYWALSMPGIALATFGPDLSFAAASIFITSNVKRSYQGSAGALLMTVQNFSAAIMTSVADVVGAQVGMNAEGEVGLSGLRAIWWFGLAAGLLGAGITVVGVRIPKEEEKAHIT